MKTLLVVSESYQVAMVREIKKFDMTLHMFPDTLGAYNNLYRMNLVDTAGFLFLDDNIKDMFGLIDLIERLNLYAGNKRRFVIAVKSKDDVQKLTVELKNKLLELKVSFLFGFDLVSDELINNCIYDILSEIEEPYLFETEDETIEDKGRINTSTYHPLFNKKLEDVITPIDKTYDSSFRECENDEIYNEFRFKFPAIAKLREGFIKAHYGETVDLSLVVEEFKESKDFMTVWCIMSSIDNIISNYRKEIL